MVNRTAWTLGCEWLNGIHVLRLAAADSQGDPFPWKKLVSLPSSFMLNGPTKPVPRRDAVLRAAELTPRACIQSFCAQFLRASRAPVGRCRASSRSVTVKLALRAHRKGARAPPRGGLGTQR